MFDQVISNGLLANPSTKILQMGHIGINQGKIAAISGEPLSGKSTFDAKGQVVSPGFIDIHSHVSGSDYSGELSARQGITTTIGGNCGGSPFDLGVFFAEQNEKGFVIHQASFIGHSTLRRELGFATPYDPATPEQVKIMEEHVRKALADGACGISLGLAYMPGSSEEEVMRLSQIVADAGRVVSVDTRLKSIHDLDSLREVVEISRRTGARTQVSHFVYQYGTGIVGEALKIIDEARAEGIDIRLDSGMYISWSSGIQAVLFDRDNLASAGITLEDILVITGPHRGNRLDEALYKKLRAETERTFVVVFSGGVEEEIYEDLRHPWSMPSTDIGMYAPGEGHPQIAGSFPRFFRKMVRERQELTLIEAIYRSTLLPAETLGLANKGRMEVGADADFVIFDPKTILDKADYLDRGLPDASPEGIEAVFVSGKLAVLQNEIQPGRYGKPIRF